MASFDAFRPPFTYQRMCDLLLDPRRYCKSTKKFLQSFAKLVSGISCDVPVDALNLNWLEQKDVSLGIPPVQFATREEDEFDHAAIASSSTNTTSGFVGGPTGVETSAPFSFTHAVLPPQQYRVGLTSSELSEAAHREAIARQQLQEQIPTVVSGAEIANDGSIISHNANGGDAFKMDQDVEMSD